MSIKLLKQLARWPVARNGIWRGPQAVEGICSVWTSFEFTAQVELCLFWVLLFV